MVKVNIDEILKNVKEFEKYNDMLPLLLMIYINNGTYIKNLKKKDLWYGNVQDKIFKRRMRTMFLNTEDIITFEDKELKQWLKKNTKYENIINGG